MNKVIHRSWGERFVKIFLDLPIHISQPLTTLIYK